MQISDSLRSPRGVLEYRVYRLGRLDLEVREDNLIVAASADIMARLLGGDADGNSVTQIGFGRSLRPAESTDTALTDENPYIKPIAAASYQPGGSVRFEFELASEEANGMQISEFGLLTGSGRLWSRRVRQSPIGKDADITLVGAWQVLF